MTDDLTTRLARAHWQAAYPDWPAERWDRMLGPDRDAWMRAAARTQAVMAVALRDGDELGFGLVARRTGV